MIKKLSPRRVILIAVAFLLLAGVCYMLWPHRFADLQPECDSVTLICMVDTTEEDVFIPTQEIYQETYSSDSAEFAQIMAAMRKTLRENGRDESIADEAEKTYKQKKNALIKELTSQAYSGGDGSGQSGRWLAEHADGNIVD